MEQSNKNQIILVVYKLLTDALFLLLLTFAFMTIAEAGIPGLISEHISFTAVIFAILLDFGIIFWLKEKIGMETKEPASVADSKLFSKPTFYIFSIFSFVLIALVIRNFNPFVIIAILIATFIIFYFLFDLLFKTEK